MAPPLQPVLILVESCNFEFFGILHMEGNRQVCSFEYYKIMVITSVFSAHAFEHIRVLVDPITLSCDC